jgi:Uma2 family endonuclease
LLVVRGPQGSPHAAAIGLAHRALGQAFGARHWVRVQSPIALDDASEPEPDLAAVPGRPRDYRDAHPSSPLLLVEIADTTLTLDRRHKGGLYARAGVPDYWIVNLRHRVLEVYRQPVRWTSSRYGWKYRNVRLLKSGSSISPLRARRARIRVADLLP